QSARSSKSSSNSKGSSRRKKNEENLEPAEIGLRSALSGENREKAKFIARLEESSDIPNVKGSSIKFESNQTVINVVIPHHRTFKRKNRSKHDPWRRYGALRKLYEIGGWYFNTKDLKSKTGGSSRRSRGAQKSKMK
ncbi:hypothetical protein PFISCL1PPCAC_6000, partial [Pristionchus fissidentatus]